MPFFACAILLLDGAPLLCGRKRPPRARALIHERWMKTSWLRSPGNTRPEANAENDLGAVSDDLSLDHMMLQLKRSPQQEQAAGAA